MSRGFSHPLLVFTAIFAGFKTISRFFRLGDKRKESVGIFLSKPGR